MDRLEKDLPAAKTKCRSKKARFSLVMHMVRSSVASRKIPKPPPPLPIGRNSHATENPSIQTLSMNEEGLMCAIRSNFGDLWIGNWCSYTSTTSKQVKKKCVNKIKWKALQPWHFMHIKSYLAANLSGECSQLTNKDLAENQAIWFYSKHINKYAFWQFFRSWRGSLNCLLAWLGGLFKWIHVNILRFVEWTRLSQWKWWWKWAAAMKGRKYLAFRRNVNSIGIKRRLLAGGSFFCR